MQCYTEEMADAVVSCFKAMLNGIVDYRSMTERLLEVDTSTSKDQQRRDC